MRKLRTALKHSNLRSSPVRGAAVCVGVSLLLLLLVRSTMTPIINDIVSDLDRPVEFIQKTKLNPYPESFKAQVKAGYPDLSPLTVRLTTLLPYELLHQQ